MTDTIIAWALPSVGLLVWLFLVFVTMPRLMKRLPGLRARTSRRRRWVALIGVGMLLLGGWTWAWLVPLPQASHDFLSGEIKPWFLGTVIMVGFLVAGFPLAGSALAFLERKASQTELKADDIVVASVRRPAKVLILLAGFLIWESIVPAPAAIACNVGTVTRVAVMLVLVLLLDAIVSNIIDRRRDHSRVFATAGTVLRSMARVVLFVLGALVVLGTVGLDVTPVIASLGVVSLAVGLALQSTIEDFIAGLLIAADQAISVGDFVELGNPPMSGTIDAVGWRTTRIMTLQQTKVVVPNATLARATLVNRSRPSPVVRFQAAVGVHYDSNLAVVARVVQEVALDVQANHPCATRDFSPVVLFNSFGESSIDLKVWLEATDWVGHFRLLDGFIRDLHARFRVEGIVIPFPIRTLDLPPAVLAAIGGIARPQAKAHTVSESTSSRR